MNMLYKKAKVFASSLGMCAAMLAAPAMLERSLQSGLGLDLGFASSAQAQGAVQKRRLPGIRETVFKDIGKVQAYTNPDLEKNPNAKPDFKRALTEIKKVETKCEKDCNPYEKSQVYNVHAYISYSLGRNAEAVKYYKKVIAQSPNIPLGVELQSMMYVAQMSFQLERHDESLNYLSKWMKLAKETNTEVGPQVWQLQAVICYQSNKKKCAFDSIKKAIKLVEDKGKIADEGWYNLLRALYLDDEDFKPATAVLEKMVRHYPKKSYYNQLGSMYGMLERPKDQLHMMDATYLMGGLTKEKEVLNLAYLYLAEDVPAKAVKIIEKGMKDKVIERNEKNLEVLGIALRQAKEPKKAIPVLEEQAKKSKSGNAYVQLLGVHLDLNQPRKAIKAGNLAIQKGNFKKNADSELYINHGIAYFEVRQFDKAIASFQKAAKIKRTARTARSWVSYAKAEKKRYEGLKKSLAAVGLDIEKVIR
jgi:tetratricopeptide (TPR) repeat protein